MLRQHYWRGLAVGVCLVAVATSASADPLDSPTISYVNSGRGTVRLLVVPGPSGAPGGFTVEWMARATYDALGGWPEATDPRIMRASFTGLPTLNTTDGTSHFKMTSVDDAGIQIGDVFDETGVATVDHAELDAGAEYVVRASANTFGTMSVSQPSPLVVVQTNSSTNYNCTYTLGYWKNHPAVWPTNSIQLGTVVYTKVQCLQIYGKPANGNGLIALAHQLIAAKLNIAQGATVPPAVAAAIAQADALIGGLVVPPIGTGYLAPSLTSALTEILDQYNNGELGVDHCSSVTPAKASSWGRLKAVYR